jgi:hypothetical protein
VINRTLIGVGAICFIAATGCFFVLAAGMGYDRGVAVGHDEGYGCGRHDAMDTRNDPAEYDLPPCAEIRKQWLWSESWPPK